MEARLGQEDSSQRGSADTASAQRTSAARPHRPSALHEESPSRAVSKTLVTGDASTAGKKVESHAMPWDRCRI
jgi:hypothetical protein